MAFNQQFIEAYDPLDARHQFVSQVKTEFDADITARKALLGTYYNAVALVDIATSRLESGVFKPSEPEWALVIRYVLLGYGCSQGVIDTTTAVGREKPTESDYNILIRGYALSSAYLRAQGDATPAQASQVFSKSLSASMRAGHVAIINQMAAAVPAEVHAMVGTVCQVRSLSQLSTYNAWSAHERFWAAGGVIDPCVPGMLKVAHAAFRGTQLGFLNELATKLETAIRSSGGAPTPEVVQDLVFQSQQILLTLAEGTPGEGLCNRLNPTSAADWQIIRKAMFLALSVTSDPEKAGRSFLSALFDCGKYYHKKTDANPIKEYYWKLEAYGYGFSTLWKGLKAGQSEATIQAELNEIRQKNEDPLYWFLQSAARTNVIERSAVDVIYKGAYQSAIYAVSTAIGSARRELAAALVLHPRLNYQQAFKTLYPDLTTWAEYHTPSKRAEDLVGAVRTKIAVPGGSKFEKIHLRYAAGKWSLVYASADPFAAFIKPEAPLWAQGFRESEEFTGEFTDARGTHLFSFRVDGATAIIKAISTGYGISIGGAGSTVTVAHGDELGIIESSANPEDTDVENYEDGSIVINGAAYNGGRGVLSARRSSVLITAPKISLSCAKGFEVRTHTNGAQYKFMVPCGQGIETANCVFFKGDDVDLSQGIIKSGVGIFAYHLSAPPTPSSLITAGSCLETSYMFVSSGIWYPDTTFTLAGMPDHDIYEGGTFSTDVLLQMHGALTPAKPRGRIEAQRALAYHVPGHVYSLGTEEPRDLLTGLHVWGIYGTKESIRPVIHMPTIQEIAASKEPQVYIYEGSGGYGGYFGGGFGARSVGKSVGSAAWGMGSKFASLTSPAFSSPMGGGTFGGVSLTGAEFGITSRGGTTGVFASITMGSMAGGMSLGATTLSFNYQTGESGRSLGLSSTYTPVTLAESVRLGAIGIDATAPTLAKAIFGVGSAAILQLTDAPGKLSLESRAASLRMDMSRGGPLSVAGVIDMGLKLAKIAGDRTREALENHVDSKLQPKIRTPVVIPPSKFTPPPQISSTPNVVVNVRVARRPLELAPLAAGSVAHSALILETREGRKMLLEYMGDSQVHMKDFQPDGYNWKIQEHGQALDKQMTPDEIRSIMESQVRTEKYNIHSHNCHLAQENTRRAIGLKVDQPYNPLWRIESNNDR